MGSLSEISQGNITPWNLKRMANETFRLQYEARNEADSDAYYARHGGSPEESMRENKARDLERYKEMLNPPVQAEPTPQELQEQADSSRARWINRAPEKMDRDAAQRDWRMRMGMPVSWGPLGRLDPTTMGVSDWMGEGSFGGQAQVTADGEGAAAGSEERARADSRLEKMGMKAREWERKWRQANDQGWVPMADGEKLRADSAESLVRARRDDKWKEFHRKNTGKLWLHTPEESAGQFSGPLDLGVRRVAPEESAGKFSGPLGAGIALPGGRPPAPQGPPSRGYGGQPPPRGYGGQPPPRGYGGQGLERPTAPRGAPAQAFQGGMGLGWRSPTRETGSRLSAGYGSTSPQGPPARRIGPGSPGSPGSQGSQGYGGPGRQGIYPRRFGL